MSEAVEDTLISHLEALRKCLILCIIATVAAYPVGYFLSPYAIKWLVRWCMPSNGVTLHYFAPMEVLWVQLRLALVLSLVLTYPWNIFQIWKFILPALYPGERRSLRLWIAFSTILFLGGVTFCILLILPLLMKFSQGFSSPELKPVIGLEGFLTLSGWLMFSFGIMFQTPVAVLLAVRFGAISVESIRQKRPYVVVLVFVAAAILTPPDIVSQIMLALPTWILFELGLFLARYMEKSKTLSREHHKT